MKYLFRYIWHGKSIGRRFATSIGTGTSALIAVSQTAGFEWSTLKNPAVAIPIGGAYIMGWLSDGQSGQEKPDA